MATFDHDGFLHGEIESWVMRTRVTHQEIISVAEEANRLFHDFLSGRDANTHGPKAFVESLLFARMLELLQAVVILTTRGMTGSSSVVFRSFIEAHFHFDAILKSDKYLDEYIDNWNAQRLRIGKAIAGTKGKDLEELRRIVSKEKLEELKRLDDESASVPSSVRRVAELGDNDGTYHTAYALLCNEAHVNSWALESYLSDDSSGSRSIRYGPNDSEIVRQIGLATHTLLDAYEALAGLFDEKVTEDKYRLSEKVEKLLETKRD